MQHSSLLAVADPVFQLQITPEAAVRHPAWQRARAAALEALFSGDATVLLGPPGSGKTLLLHDLARTLRNADQPVRLIRQPGALDGPRGDDILLVDEADALGADALAALCAGPAPVLLAALPSFAERLAAHPVRHVALDPLAPEDVARFVAIRLAAVGRPRDLLEPEAVLALARHSGGLLRLVNTIGGAALFLAGWDGSPRVGLRHVEEAAAMRNDSGEVAPPPAAGPSFASMGNDTGEAAPPLPAELSFARLTAPPPVAELPNYSGALLRRRAVLGGMATAAGVLFALPWLTRKPPGESLPAALTGTGTRGVAGQTSQVAQAGIVAPTQPVADVGGPTVAATPTSAQPELAVPDAQQTAAAHPAAAAPPREAEPQRQAEPQRLAESPRQAEPQRLTALDRPAPATARHMAAGSETALLFQGPIFNETMGQGGHVSLVIQKQAPTGAITARFNASQGLVGSGVLAGSVSGTGRVTASGQLLMGRNSFLCDLNGVLVGDTLTGSASFARPNGGVTYHSRFSLVRA